MNGVYVADVRIYLTRIQLWYVYLLKTLHEVGIDTPATHEARRLYYLCKNIDVLSRTNTEISEIIRLQ